MWRTSWLSREVIVLPAFIAVVVLWWLALRDGRRAAVDAIACSCRSPLIAVAALLWYCTAMIYACLRFIEEWAQPLTLVNFVLLGLSSGFVLASALARARRRARAASPRAVRRRSSLTLLAVGDAHGWRCAATPRSATARRCSRPPASRAARLVQTSMGMSAGSFNTREFFHRASRAGDAARQAGGDRARASRCRSLAACCSAWPTAAAPPWLVAALLQAPGLLADRWFFFAQAKHPQNLYYQVVS